MTEGLAQRSFWPEGARAAFAVHNDVEGEKMPYREMADALRSLSLDTAASMPPHHPGRLSRMADVATVLFARHFKFDPNYATSWCDRDRLVLSASYGSPLLYALLHLTGYPRMSIDELQRFRRLGSITPGHPEVDRTPGVEATTGPLGQGLANAVGMALAERMLAARYGKNLVDHHTYVVVGAGCLSAGLSQEAISLAGQLRLNKMIALLDDCRSPSEDESHHRCVDDQLDRFVACGWAVKQVDGHQYEEISGSLDAARDSRRPTLIVCRTVDAADSRAGAGQAQQGRDLPQWSIPDSAQRIWRLVGERGSKARVAWEARLAAINPETRSRFLRDSQGTLAADIDMTIRKAKRAAQERSDPEATQTASRRVVDLLKAVQPNLVSGATDWAHLEALESGPGKPVSWDDFSGSHISFGVREYAMAAVMNGIALHGGLIPYGQTLLASSDNCRSAIRLSALMRRRVVYVMTHDSICIGEEGPVLQAVEQLAALRTIPGLLVIRPADAVETAEAWEVALRSEKAPTVLCLSSRCVPVLRTAGSEDNRVVRGGYVVHQACEPRRATIIASGSEVAIALEAARLFSRGGTDIAVVSMPCFRLFAEQPQEYRDRVLGTAPRLAIEAGVRDGWDHWIGADGDFVGMSGFGASAPMEALYENFCITAEQVVAVLRQRLASACVHAAGARQ